MDNLVYLHLFSPLLLLAPVLRLLPSPPEPEPELDGIRPITVRVVTPRRSLILLSLTLLAFTSTLDAARLIADVATSHARERLVGGLPLWSEVVYAFGGLCVWALAAILIEWRAKWGDRGLISLGVLGLVCEVPNLVLLVLRQTKHNDIFNILAIPPPALRILLLPLLITLVSRPVVRYEPAETSSLLPEPARAYGTFDAPKPDGPNIPKTLGEIKKEDKPLTWREIWVRLKKLSPRLWPSTSRKLQLFVALCILSILLGRLAAPLSPIILGDIVNELIAAQAGQPANPFVPFGVYFALKFLLSSSGLLSFVNNVLWVPVAQYTDREMQLLCFNHLLDLSLAYHTKRNTGEVLKIIDRGSAINNLFQTLLFTAIPTILDIIISFGVFFYLYGGLLAFVTLVVMAAYVIFSVTQTNWRMRLRRVMVDKDVKQRGIVSDVLTNWESVKYFTAEERESRRFRESIVSYQETEAKVQIGFNLLFLVQYFLLTLGLALGGLIIALRILDNRANAAAFVVFTQYYAQLQGPLNNFGWLYRIFNQETTDAEKMFTLLEQKTEVKDMPGAKDLVVTDGVIEFDNVCFSYDGKVDALKGVSFRLGKGESLALVGESGSGKSTILRLLYRFYDITSGKIYIDGQDISLVTQVSLRRAIGIVPQDSVLWNDTIGANVSYGKEGAGDDEIIAAAKAARLHDRIMGFPEQYETIVGERGVRLSGGEKQRVSLARMFLKSPAILVLDEATSALDTETEREIQKALAELAKGRSSLSIAHRLSTIINSDTIVVMKDGRVIEKGGYKELLEFKGVFASMWKKQIFTEAEIMAQSNLPSGIPSVASSGESTPKEAPEAPEKGAEEVTQPEPANKDAETPAPDADVEGATEVTAMGADKTPEPTTEAAEPAAAPEAAPPAAAPGTASPAPPASPTLPAEATYADAVKDHPEPTQPDAPAKSDATPTTNDSPRSNRVSFPPLPHSHSHRSDLSTEDTPSTPGSANASTTDLGKDGDKRRKRLSSLKGFVRRISDQGVSRSNSFKSFVGDSPKVDEPAQAGSSQGNVPAPAAEGKKNKRKGRK